MSYYDDPQNVEQYIKMAEGYDGRELIPLLRQVLADGSTVLELGMGPGVDLDLLAQHYQVTGSDMSDVFLERYRQIHPTADLLHLDAVTLDTTRVFDCIYSNKVLHHLKPHELRTSLQRQATLLQPGGIALHTFWQGDSEEQMHGMHFSYYTPESLSAVVGDEFKILTLDAYAEMEADDSLCLILKRNPD